MSSKKTRKLDPEEKVLWRQVKRTVSPISGHTAEMEEWLESDESRKPSTTESGSANRQTTGPDKSKTFLPSYSPPVSSKKEPDQLPGKIDDTTARKLSRGRLAIEDRIDLHGMTQHQAHSQLLYFLQHCQDSGKRIVLVITGKGRQNDGVLRSLVPQWFREPLLRSYVSGFRESHLSHGGSGALYVRIRRTERIRSK